MAVVADFTANKLTGLKPPSEAIQFTDASTGSPDTWLWDFGDGSFASVQNPLHTFSGEFGTTFTVKLTAWITDANTAVTKTDDDDSFKTSNVQDTNELAYAAYLSASSAGFGKNLTAYMATKTAVPNYTYEGTDHWQRYTIPTISTTIVAVVAEAWLVSTDVFLNRTVTTQEGSFEMRNKTTQEVLGSGSGVGAYNTRFPVIDLSSLGGTDMRIQQTANEVQINSFIDNTHTGFIAFFDVRQYTVLSPDDQDEIEKFVLFVDDATIDFVGTPLTGISPLEVQFTDLSTVNHAISVWDFGDGNTVTFAGETHPLNTYTSDNCSLSLL